MKNFSWGPFFIGALVGFILGVLLLGLFVNYLISHALSGAPTSGQFLGANIDQVREGIANATAEQQTKAVYGHVVSIGAGTLVLTVAETEGPKQFTFRYDDATVFVYLANDAASTEEPLSADAITVGTGLNVLTNEAVGSVANQYAVKVIRI